jgi:hypothetical protein
MDFELGHYLALDMEPPGFSMCYSLLSFSAMKLIKISCVTAGMVRGNNVRAEASVNHPLSAGDGVASRTYAPSGALQVGRTYELPSPVPLMPQRAPADPIAALSSVRRLPANARRDDLGGRPQRYEDALVSSPGLQPRGCGDRMD